MRLIFSYLLLVLSFSNVCAQDNNNHQSPDSLRTSDTPMLNYIYRLQYEIRKSQQQKDTLTSIVSGYIKQLENERNKSKQDAQVIRSIYSKLNQAKSSHYRLSNAINSKNDSLQLLYSIIDTLRTNNKELKKILDNKREEVSQLTEESGKRSISFNELQRDAELLGLMLSGFNNFEVGFIRNGKMEVHKKYDSSIVSPEDVEVSYKNSRLFSERLNVLNYSGTLCVPKTTSLGQEIPGEILIYVNEKLTYRLKDKLNFKIDNNFSNIQCYEVISFRKVDFNFPPKANIRVGFISNETLRHLKEDDLTNFWESEEKGYFMISSLKSTYKLNFFSDSLLVKNAVIIDSFYVNGSEVDIDIYDNGYVDGDIASFYINGVMEIDQLSLKSVAVRRRINLKEDINILTLVANSQGEVAPCTARIVLFEGNVERWAITLSGTEKKSHSIKIIRSGSRATGSRNNLR